MNNEYFRPLLLCAVRAPTGNEYVSASAGNDVCREGEFWILSR